jgi:hypothetical protein
LKLRSEARSLYPMRLVMEVTSFYAMIGGIQMSMMQQACSML